MKRVFSVAQFIRLRHLALWLVSAHSLLASSAWAFDSGSTGADGALSPAVDTAIQLPPSGVLNYTTINIPSGVKLTFKRNALNTPVVLLATGNVTIAGTIDVSGTQGANIGTSGDGNLADDGLPGIGGPGGFDGGRGGGADSAQRAAIIDGGAGQGPGGGQGGRVAGAPYTTPNGNTCRENRGNGYETYGMGAGHAVPGSDAAFAPYQCQGQSPAGSAYGSPRLQPLIGGSGGGGGRGSTSLAGSGGGGGGGAIMISASGSVSITGSIVADGGRSGRYQSTPGGAGSGGAVHILATSIGGTGQVYARRACGQNTNGSESCDGASPSSAGRIRLAAETITFSGTTSPLYSADTPSVSASPTPVVRISSVAGTAVPAQPTGVGDIVLPSGQSNPVTVAFATVNVPVGSTIKLRVVPAQGLPIDAISSPIAGSLSNGTATASVNLPQGPSRLEASTSFTVNLAMGEALSRYAGNEVVRSVEIESAFGGPSRALLTTTSGKRYEVPTDLLRTFALGAES